jgi:hypothetical protein
LNFSFYSTFPPPVSTLPVPSSSFSSIAVPLFLSLLFSLCFLLSAGRGVKTAQTIKQRHFV